MKPPADIGWRPSFDAPDIELGARQHAALESALQILAPTEGRAGAESDLLSAAELYRTTWENHRSSPKRRDVRMSLSRIAKAATDLRASITQATFFELGYLTDARVVRHDERQAMLVGQLGRITFLGQLGHIEKVMKSAIADVGRDRGNEGPMWPEHPIRVLVDRCWSVVEGHSDWRATSSPGSRFERLVENVYEVATNRKPGDLHHHIRQVLRGR